MNVQYPNVSIEQKQSFWQEILAVFEGVAADFSRSSLNATSLQTLVARQHRAVFYVADYLQMTGYAAEPSPAAGPYFALDSCLIDNQLGNPSGPAAVDHQRQLFAAADQRKAEDRAAQRLYLVSLVGDMNYVDATLLRFGQLDKIPKDDAELVAECAAGFDTPGMDWCPETLLDGSQLANYYTQVAMDEVLAGLLAGEGAAAAGGLPHAVYLNALGGLDGSIRTGTEVLWGRNRSPDPAHATRGFAYVDSFVLYNVLTACGAGSVIEGEGSDDCQSLTDELVQRRAQNPLTLWEDEKYGRLTTW
jgi:hypothetical protein